MASKIEMEVELKSEAEKVWNSMRESTTLFPKALPQHYQSIQILEGDGKSVNSVRLVTYPQGYLSNPLCVKIVNCTLV